MRILYLCRFLRPWRLCPRHILWFAPSEP
jgi:hypothetical protein